MVNTDWNLFWKYNLLFLTVSENFKLLEALWENLFFFQFWSVTQKLIKIKKKMFRITYLKWGDSSVRLSIFGPIMSKNKSDYSATRKYRSGKTYEEKEKELHWKVDTSFGMLRTCIKRTRVLKLDSKWYNNND